MAQRERRKRGRRSNGEGSVYLRKDGRWAVDITLEGYARKRYYFKTEKEAIEGRRVLLNELAKGTLATGPQKTVKDYLEDWLENVQKDRLRTSSYVKYKKLMNSYIVPAIGHIRLQKLTPQHVQSLYTKKLRDGLAPKTVYSIHGLLHHALDNAVKWNLVSGNVTERVTPPRLEKREREPLTLEQAHKLLEVARGDRLEMLIVLALTTGMRRGELLALRWSDIDFEGQSLQVRRTVDFIARYGYVENEPKTARGKRKILLPAFVVEILKQHRINQLEQRLKVGEAWYNLDLVICGLEGNYLNPRYLLKLFDKLLKEACLPHMHFHDLRHSVVTLLLSMGVDPRSIQEFVGHEDITTTLGIYSHMLPSMQRGIVDKLDDLFGGQT
ncbi:MAG: tyrosine-type recombinase/integrase [Chloroflexota bacterium]|nr:tyrosine-type recombinase/integrase [Chloroflexota bacterium]